MGLYKGGLKYGWAYTWTIFCVSNKQVRHKQVGHKQGNKRVLRSDYWAYINWGTYIRGAYIWNDVSVSTCGGLLHGGLIFGGGGLYRGGSRGSQISHATNVKKRHIKKFGLRFLNFFPAQTLLFISDHAIKTPSHSSI
jgi:hypothetical protein